MSNKFETEWQFYFTGKLGDAKVDQVLCAYDYAWLHVDVVLGEIYERS